jgi:hypothetical protein
MILILILLPSCLSLEEEGSMELVQCNAMQCDAMQYCRLEDLERICVGTDVNRDVLSRQTSEE